MFRSQTFSRTLWLRWLPLVLLGGFAARPPLRAQNLNPATPAKEYIQFNGQAVAFETPCQYSLSQAGQSLSPSAQTSTATVTTTAGCEWTAISHAGWISIVSGSSGNGTGTVSFSLTGNVSAQPRTSSLTIAGFTYVVTQAGSGNPTPISGPLYFVPIPPCRVIETRWTAGPLGGPALVGGQTRDFPLLSGNCNLPASAQAYSLNISVVPSQSLGYLQAWPTGQAIPSEAVVLNSFDGRVKANAAIIQAGTNGSISLYASNNTNVFVDVNGYFTSDSSQAYFFPMYPCRAADTRGSAGPYLAGGTTRNFSLASSCSVPMNASAYLLNITAIPHGSLGYITVWGAGQGQPGTSTLNAPTGTVVANTAIVAPGAGGQITVYASNDTDLIIDVAGWFNPGKGGYALHTIGPCRAFDTRSTGTGAPFSGEKTVSISGSSCGVPSTAGAYVLNAGVIPSGALTYLQLWADSAPQPATSVLNASDGAITSNLAITSNSNGSVDAFASNPTQLVLDVFGFFTPAGAPVYY